MFNRRDILIAGAGAAFHAVAPSLAEGSMRTRKLPGTAVELPVVGLGNSVAFRESDIATSTRLLRLLHQAGGRYVDCGGVSRFVVAEAAAAAGAADAILPGAYFDISDAATARDEAVSLQKAFGREKLPLMQCFTDQVDAHWETLVAFKEQGLTERIGTARHQSSYYDTMIALMKTGTLDVLQVNYSILEPEAEERVLPTAMDAGVAVMINRPFINGKYFSVVSGHPLPEWAAEFDCESWAQFSLKFILSHPAVNCVLTETANPKHAVDNLSAGFGRLPDARTREKMRAHMQSLL